MEYSYNFSEIKPESGQKKIILAIILIASLLLLSTGIFFIAKTGLVKIFGNKGDKEGYLNLVSNRPVKDPTRINILFLGLRGESDPYGGLLTDTMMILSLKNDGRVALISIPRDLYIQMPRANSNAPQKEKINAAYALGRERLGEKGGLIYSKAVISEVTGLYLDYAISFDFIAFEKIVDILGGVTVYLDRPFMEEAQFAGQFNVNLPVGKNILDGQTALYYVRSRYSTSDFDRARRQQQVLIAITEKARSSGIALNPVKIYGILNVLGQHIRTDIIIDDIKKLIADYPKNISEANIIKKVFDTTPDGLLYSIHEENGAYILLPVNDNFDRIRKVCREIFN